MLHAFSEFSLDSRVIGLYQFVGKLIQTDGIIENSNPFTSKTRLLMMN